MAHLTKDASSHYKQYGYTVGLSIKTVTSICTLRDVLNIGGVKQLLSQARSLLQPFQLPLPLQRGHSQFFEG